MRQLEVGDYEEDGYTRNIDQIFLENAPLEDIIEYL